MYIMFCYSFWNFLNKKCSNKEKYKFWSMFKYCSLDVWVLSLISLVYFLESTSKLCSVLLKVVEKNESEAIWRIDALQKVLKEVHSLFLMFHGSIRALLEKEPAGRLLRSHLYPFIMDYLRGNHHAIIRLLNYPKSKFLLSMVQNISL